MLKKSVFIETYRHFAIYENTYEYQDSNIEDYSCFVVFINGVEVKFLNGFSVLGTVHKCIDDFIMYLYNSKPLKNN